MKVIKGLFFDLDNTLLNTEESQFRAYQKALKVHGRRLTHVDHQRVFGNDSGTFLPMLFPDITDDEVRDIRRLKAGFYEEFMHLVRPNVQLIDFFRTVRPHHITALVTTGKRANILPLLEAHLLTHLFDHVILGEDVENFKPHPEAYQKALKLSGLQADEVLAFEDSDTGVESAQAAGINVIKITIPKTKS